MTIKVRQGSCKIAKVGMSSTVLITKDISTCTGLVGIHKSKEIAFLAHFDSPWSVSALRKAAKEIEAQGYSFSDFDMIKISGADPKLTYLFFLLTTFISTLYILNIITWPNGWYILACCFCLWALSGITRISLCIQLWLLNAKTCFPKYWKTDKFQILKK